MYNKLILLLLVIMVGSLSARRNERSEYKYEKALRMENYNRNRQHDSYPGFHKQFQLQNHLEDTTSARRNSVIVEEKICIGTNGRMSVPSNRTHHYRNLRERYTGCTYVDGNLEITWLEDQSMQLDFLQHIREVTGYVLISHVYVKNIILPRLQIIRGRTLFKLNIYDKQFGLFVSYSQMETLEMPALRDILGGSVLIFNNENLCHIQGINWEEIITGPAETFNYTNNSTFPEPKCSKCDDTCTAGCWGEGAHNCQKFSKVNCAPQCADDRCFGSHPRECCHSFCAGGCTGPTQKDCLACRNFNDDGECKQTCPPIQKYNLTSYMWEPNPEGKYAYGAECVLHCPEHMLTDNGACVRVCPAGKTNQNGECILCNGPCPKTCVHSGVIHSGNIEKFRDCTIIEGTIEILDQTFNGFQEIYPNFTFGKYYSAMDPDRLEVFSTLREVTGYVSIQGAHSRFTNLTYFRSLEVIGGRQLFDTFFASLSIIKTNLTSLGLRSLKHIHSGTVVILENRSLCFASDLDWRKIKNSSNGNDIMIGSNRSQKQCRRDGLDCSEMCTKAGCWDVGANQCVECKHVKFNGVCMQSCQSQPNIYTMPDNVTCDQCHPECRSCFGPFATDCLECVHVRDGRHCVPNCPKTKYATDGVCVNCHESCVGCTGPNNTIGSNGCIACDKVIIIDNQIDRCLRKDEYCPDGFFYEFVDPLEQGVLKSLAGKATCQQCHPSCKRCTGYGSHQQVCRECIGYKLGDQCEDECPSDHYADEVHRECFPCNIECRGCKGPGADNCIDCRNFRLYSGDPSDSLTTFNCSAICPKEFPYKVSALDRQYCSTNSTTYSVQSNETPIDLIVTIIVLIVLFGIVSISTLHCRQVKMKKNIVNMTRAMGGYKNAEPLRPSNIEANLTKLTIIQDGELSVGKLLGRGAFGEVFEGVWKSENFRTRIPVAIKMLTTMNHHFGASKDFLNEALIMTTIDHDNLLRLLGVCMTGKMMLVTQLMPLGSLLEYVRTNGHHIGALRLLDWSMQIAEGMAYLEQKRLVHRDLAARNVLVQTASNVKIADFGLARLLRNDSEEFRLAGRMPMPMKWMALECIRHHKFTTKSDVWAFGVTIWELITFGYQPYENIPARELTEKIEAGHRLEQPDYCSVDLYCTLLACWQIEVDSRPTFKELVDIFTEYVKDPERYLVITAIMPEDTGQNNTELICTLAVQHRNPLIVNIGIDNLEYLMCGR